MAGTMSRADLVADLKASLHDAATIFTAANDADFSRQLDIAAQDMGPKRARSLHGQLTLVAGTATYDAPAGLVAFSSDLWSMQPLPSPWEPSFPGPLPRVSVIGDPNTRQLLFSPTPTAAHLAVLGSTFRFLYRAAHSISDTASATTVAAADRGLLLLRAQAEAMREMAIRNAGKPVQMRDGYTGQTRNGTPAALFEALFREFKEATL